MQPLRHFIVRLDKAINDTITTEDGTELCIDIRWNEFVLRVMEGEVIQVPAKYDTGVQVGDTLYFHHLVVMNMAVGDGQRIEGTEDQFLVKYDPIVVVGNQSIAYMDTFGDVHPLKGWTLVEPMEGSDDAMPKTFLHVPDTYKARVKDQPVRGRIAFINDEAKAMGLDKGDVVRFRKGIDYSIKVEGKTYWRIPLNELIATQVEHAD